MVKGWPRSLNLNGLISTVKGKIRKMLEGWLERSYSLDRTRKVRCVVEDSDVGRFEVLDGDHSKNKEEYTLIKDLRQIATELGLESQNLPPLVNKDCTNVLRFLGYCKRTETDKHKSAVFEYAPYSLKDIHAIYRTTQRYIPESMIWNVFRDVVRAGGNLEISKLWHPGLNLSNVLFSGAKGKFKISSPFIHDSFLRKYCKVKDDMTEDYQLDEINKNVKQVGLTLLALTSLAEFEELKSGSSVNQDNVHKALKITKLIYSGDLYTLIIYLLHGNNNDQKLTFAALRKGVI